MKFGKSDTKSNWGGKQVILMVKVGKSYWQSLDPEKTRSSVPSILSTANITLAENIWSRAFQYKSERRMRGRNLNFEIYIWIHDVHLSYVWQSWMRNTIFETILDQNTCPDTRGHILVLQSRYQGLELISWLSNQSPKWEEERWERGTLGGSDDTLL